MSDVRNSEFRRIAEKFSLVGAGAYETFAGGKPATAFLFKLISQLQFSGTVPMIDVQAYAQWLAR